MKLNKKGFTIVELVIVIAVIAILAAVLIPTFNSVISKANESAALQEAKAAESVVILEESGDVNSAIYYYVVFDKEVKADYGSETPAKPKYVYIYKASTNEIFKNVSDKFITDGALVEDLANAVYTNAYLKHGTDAKVKGTNSDLSNKLLVFKVTNEKLEGESAAADHFNYYVKVSDKYQLEKTATK